MKYILLLSLICITQPSIANEEVLELNAENLTLLALKNSSQEAVEEYALYLVRSTRTKEYFRAMRDKKKLDELVNQEKNKLTAKLNKINKLGHYKFKKVFSYKSYDKDSSTLHLKKIISQNVFDVFRAYDDMVYLPSTFLLLTPNTEIIKSVKVNKKRFERLLSYWSENNQSYKNTLYLEIIFNVGKFQNSNDFQATVQRLDIYSSKNKKTLLASKVEKRNYSELVSNWLLSSGFSSPLVGIHAFSYFSIRLQDQLVIQEHSSKTCKKTKKIGSHQAIVCTQPYTKSTELVISYLGGRVAQIDVVSLSPLAKHEINKVKQDIKRFLKSSDPKVNHSFIKWSKHGVNFRLVSDGFINKQSKESSYKNIFETSSSPKKRALILTMMADGTKKLLTDLGVKL